MNEQKIKKFIKIKNKGKIIFNNVKIDSNDFINLNYGLANNCSICHWYPCICKELEEYYENK